MGTELHLGQTEEKLIEIGSQTDCSKYTLIYTKSMIIL